MSSFPGANPLFRAQQLIRLRRYEEAVALLATAIASDPANAVLRQHMAQSLLGLERAEEAQREAETAIRLDPNAEWSFRLRSVAMLQRSESTRSRMDDERRSAAVGAAREAVRLAPMVSATHMQLANALLANRSLREAQGSAEEAVRLAPTSAAPYNTLGLVALRMSRSVAAEAAFRRALQIDPNFAEALNNLGLVARSAGRRTQAPELFGASARANPRLHHGPRNAARMSNTLIGQVLITGAVVLLVLAVRAIYLAQDDQAWLVVAFTCGAGASLCTRLWRRVRDTLRPRLLRFSLTWLGLTVSVAIALGAGLVLAFAHAPPGTETTVALLSLILGTLNLGWLRVDRIILRAPPDLYRHFLIWLGILLAGFFAVFGLTTGLDLLQGAGPNASDDRFTVVVCFVLGLPFAASAWVIWRRGRRSNAAGPSLLDRLEAEFRKQPAKNEIEAR